MDAKTTAYEAGLDAMFSCDHRNGSDGPYPCQACARHGLRVGVMAAIAAALEDAAKVAEVVAGGPPIAAAIRRLK